jgi:FkbM family methyltransferase
MQALHKAMLRIGLRSDGGDATDPGSTLAPRRMPLPGLVPGPGGEFADVFRFLYGREPDAEEQVTLNHLPRNGDGWVHLFRPVLGRFETRELKVPVVMRFGPEDVCYVRVGDVSVAIDRHDAAVGYCLYHTGAYESHMTQFFQQHLKPGMTVVDVGANIGYYTMLAASLVGSEGSVHAFEPNSENCRLILLSLEKNGLRNVRLLPVALSDQPGYSLFATNVGSNGGLLRDRTEKLMEPTCQVVPTFRLDDLMSGPVHFLKLDTEGAEGLVLGGAGRLIEANRPLIVSEFSPVMLSSVSNMDGRDYLAFFRALGYRQFILERESGQLTPVPDPDAFLNNYSSPHHIEDLAFLPAA